MATYYVRPGASGNGTGQALNQAWGTIAQALAASGGITSGDTLYIAPGNYNEQLTVNITSPTAATYIIGDTTASQFIGMTPGYVRITAYPSNQALANTFSGAVFSATSKNYLNISNLHFEGTSSTSLVDVLTSRYTNFYNCSFINHDASGSRCLTLSKTSGTVTPIDATVNRCTFLTMKGASNRCVLIDGGASANMSLNVTFNDCLMFSSGTGTWINGSTSDWNGGVSFYNCTIIAGVTSIYNANGGASSTYPHIVKNCILHSPTGVNNQAGVTSYYQITYTRILAGANIAVSTSGTGTSTTGALGLELGYALTNSLSTSPLFSSVLSSPNQNFGNATSAPLTDLYNIAWSGTSPDAGAATYNNVSSINIYNPTERNASTITIAPGSTSQSIELYLGVTGLAFNTSGLSAYYIRNRSAPVAITLVTQTATGAWTSGGFAEISSSLTPGVYRLDVPDAAFAAGASDVTIVVRGASGTNGVVVTVTLSAGGLTASQTADAVLDAVASTHNNIGSIGAFIQDKTGYSLSTSQTFNTTGSVGSVAGNVTGNVTGTVGGVAGNIVGNLTGSVGTVATPDNIIDGVWDEQRVGHTASGSFGEKLQTNAMADEMLARDLGSGLNAGTAEERTVRSALRALRNKVNVGSSQMVVKKEDDTTDAWTASVTTTAVSSNVSGIDPN